MESACGSTTTQGHLPVPCLSDMYCNLNFSHHGLDHVCARTSIVIRRAPEVPPECFLPDHTVSSHFRGRGTVQSKALKGFRIKYASGQPLSSSLCPNSCWKAASSWSTSPLSGACDLANTCADLPLLMKQNTELDGTSEAIISNVDALAAVCSR